MDCKLNLLLYIIAIKIANTDDKLIKINNHKIAFNCIKHPTINGNVRVVNFNKSLQIISLLSCKTL